ncbi:hypothetical protein CJ030_MR2G021715 [Morella rubra]|uniref:Transmembrane protein n=1 Tax=Morella rubra TaxID=262757 RepID=A0A6A1WGT6_9ROSI|nr:hypothetical protein CJ030_MR2G021715 [Morella rubra]
MNITHPRSLKTTQRRSQVAVRTLLETPKTNARFFTSVYTISNQIQITLKDPELRCSSNWHCSHPNQRRNTSTRNPWSISSSFLFFFFFVVYFSFAPCILRDSRGIATSNTVSVIPSRIRTTRN